MCAVDVGGTVIPRYVPGHRPLQDGVSEAPAAPAGFEYI